MHAHGVGHRGLSPNSVRVSRPRTGDQRLNLTVCDLGTASFAEALGAKAALSGRADDGRAPGEVAVFTVVGAAPWVVVGAAP